MKNIIEFILHIDRYIQLFINQFGAMTYFIIFGIIFAETGFVVTPFLPGDSLLFVIGALSAKGWLNIWLSFALLIIAAVAGDALNYWIGHKIGRRAFRGKHIFNEENLIKTEAFYEKHGGKTIILARFIPIIRTFAPFVAGVGKMTYSKFFSFNVVGGFAWVSLFLFGGYFFGNIPAVKENFTMVVIAIIFLSVVPALAEWLRNKFRRKHES